MDKKFVVLIDRGSLGKHFERRVWDDAKKAAEYCNHIYGNRNSEWTIFELGSPVVDSSY